MSRIHLFLNEVGARWSDLPFAGGKPHRPLEAGRPTGGKQLLGVSAVARGAGNRKSNVQAAIVAARGPRTPTCGVGFGGVLNFSLF